MRTTTPGATDNYLLSTATANDRIYFASATQVGWLTDGTGTTMSLGVTLEANVWEFWTFVSDGGTYRIYRNGMPAATSSQSPSNGLDYSHIGVYGASESATCFEGVIDELAIWNTVLSPAEVRELYNNGSPIDAQTHSEASTLQAYWRNNNLNTDNKMKDLIGSNHATITEAGDDFHTMFFQEGATSGKDSQGITNNIDHTGSKGAIYFDGVSDYIDFGRNISIDGDFTVQFWMKRVKSGSWLVVFGGTTTSYDALYIKSNGVFQLRLGDSSYLDISYTHAFQTWQNIAFVRSAGTVKTYLNATDVSDDETHSGQLNIKVLGCSGNLVSHFGGWLDEFKIYDRALTAGQVSKNYKYGLSKHSN